MKATIETHTIDVIPLSERHGRPLDLFTLWFGNNLHVLSLVTGALAIQLGLSFWWACPAILIGNALGALPVAYHAIQGPHLGVPQMIQTRAQFGYYGASFLVGLVFFISFGYFASAQALGGTTIVVFSPQISTECAIVLLSVPVLLLAFLGHDWIHRWQRAVAVLLGLCVVYITIRTLARHGLHMAHSTTAAPSLTLFLGVVAIFAVYQLTWAPYVADYSRYLPPDVSTGRTFAATFLGQVMSAVWIELIAAYLMAVEPDPRSSDALTVLAQGAGKWVVVIMAVSLIGSAATMLYSGMLSLVTLVGAHSSRLRAVVRTAGILVTLLVGLPIALVGYKSFVTAFAEFLQICLFVLIPWSAVNLADFYLVRRGQYDVESLFTPRGIYGRWQWRGLCAYFVGLAVEMPFINQARYVGPAARALGGADISWIVGLVVPAALYVILCRTLPLVPTVAARTSAPRGDAIAEGVS